MIKRMDALQTQTVKSTTAPQPNYIPGLIAVVGCDGTGKSTLTNDLVKSLQQHWQTERRYLGLLSGEDGDKIKRLPLVGVWCYLLDGMFIGATRAAEMRNSMAVAAAGFALTLLTLPWLGNHGLWLALTVFLALRGLSLAAIWRRHWRNGTWFAAT